MARVSWCFRAGKIVREPCQRVGHVRFVIHSVGAGPVQRALPSRPRLVRRFCAHLMLYSYCNKGGKSCRTESFGRLRSR